MYLDFDKLQSKGYDGIIARMDTYAHNDDMEYAVFSPSQIKSADPVTYDDNGNVIPLRKRFDSSNNDIRYQRRGRSEEEVRDEIASDVRREFMAASAEEKERAEEIVSRILDEFMESGEEAA